MSENWKTYKLGDLTTKIGSGATPRGGKEAYLESGISLIRSQNVLDFSFSVDGLAFIDDAQAKALNNVTIESRDVLLNITGDSVARVCQVPDKWLPARVNQHVAIIRANKDLLCPEFLLYSLLTKANKNTLLTLASAGATRNALTKQMIEDFEISIPGIEEQRSIASILSAIDDKIELNLQMNKTLEEMAMTLYKHWFVDFGPFKDGEFVDSELGMIPKGWEVKRLSEFWDNSQYGYTQSSSLESIGPKFLRITDIQGGAVDWNNVPYCIANNNDIKKYKIIKGDLFVARTGNSTGENLYVLNAPEAVFASYLIRFQFDALYKSCFVAKIFRSKRFSDYINGAKVGSAQPGISASTLGEFLLIIPPTNLLKEFFSHANNYDEQKETNLMENQTLTTLRDTLLPKLISGEVRVKEAEKILEETL
ncbi:MAG: restriction endonuclease subunit S [Mariniphaga sp.]